jgi:hypothetical protein
MRMIAIFLMVLVHFIENLSGTNWNLAGLSAPLFSFLVGMSYFLWIEGLDRKGNSETDISKASIRRGAFLFGLGFAFNVLVWLPEDTFNWDILTLVGVTYFALNLARQLPISVILFFCFMVILVSPVLKSTADYPSYWTEGFFDPDMILSDVILGFLVTGYFPIFPWIIYSLIGFVVAKYVFVHSTADSVSNVTLKPLVWIGILLVSLSFIMQGIRNLLPNYSLKPFIEGWTMFPASLEYILTSLGWALLLFSFFHHFIDKNPKSIRYKPFIKFASLFSRNSLTMYILHHVVHLWPLWIYGLWMGQDATSYWRYAMPTYYSVPLAIIFIVGSYFLFRWMEKTNRVGIEGLMRKWCDT